MLENIRQTSNYLKSKIEEIPNTAIILGTGLGELVHEIDNKQIIPYTEIPNFPVSTVEGHSGKRGTGKYRQKSRIKLNPTLSRRFFTNRTYRFTKFNSIFRIFIITLFIV